MVWQHQLEATVMLVLMALRFNRYSNLIRSPPSIFGWLLICSLTVVGFETWNCYPCLCVCVWIISCNTNPPRCFPLRIGFTEGKRGLRKQGIFRRFSFPPLEKEEERQNKQYKNNNPPSASRLDQSVPIQAPSSFRAVAAITCVTRTSFDPWRKHITLLC